MWKPIDSRVFMEYALHPTRHNWETLVHETSDSMYSLAQVVTGDAKQAAAAAKGAYSDLYKQYGIGASQMENTLYRQVMNNAGRLMGNPVVGNALEDGVHVPDTSRECIPAAFNDDPGYRRMMMDLVRQQTPHVRTAVMLHFVCGLSVEQVAEIMECDAATITNRINQMNSSLHGLVDSLRAGTGARLHNPETLSDLMRRSLSDAPTKLAGRILGATVRSPFLHLSIAFRRAMFATDTSVGASVRSGFAGSLVGGTAIGGVMGIGSLLTTGIVAMSIFSGSGVGTVQNYISRNYPASPSMAIQALMDKGYVRPTQLDNRVFPELPVVPTKTDVKPDDIVPPPPERDPDPIREVISIVQQWIAPVTQTDVFVEPSPTDTSPTDTPSSDSPLSDPLPSGPPSGTVNAETIKNAITLFGEYGGVFADSSGVFAGGPYYRVTLNTIYNYHVHGGSIIIDELMNCANADQFLALEAELQGYKEHNMTGSGTYVPTPAGYQALVTELEALITDNIPLWLDTRPPGFVLDEIKGCLEASNLRSFVAKNPSEVATLPTDAKALSVVAMSLATDIGNAENEFGDAADSIWTRILYERHCDAMEGNSLLYNGGDFDSSLMSLWQSSEAMTEMRTIAANIESGITFADVGRLPEYSDLAMQVLVDEMGKQWILPSGKSLPDSENYLSDMLNQMMTSSAVMLDVETRTNAATIGMYDIGGAPINKQAFYCMIGCVALELPIDGFYPPIPTYQLFKEVFFEWGVVAPSPPTP